MELPGWLKVYLKGVLMGAADTVPGVSGGTIALITGIYERLVDAVASLTRLPSEARQGSWKEEFDNLDIFFLAILGSGVATSVVLLSRVMHSALTVFPAPTNALFLGLIGASAVVLYREVSLDTAGRMAAAVAGFAAAFTVAGVSGSGFLGHSFPVVFLTGVVASAAMLLPGISGAAFLYILGQYAYMTGALKRVVDAVATFNAGPGFTGDVAAVLIFIAGVAAGLLTVARAVSRALERNREATMAALVSLMVGSLRLPVEEILGATAAWDATGVAAVLVPAAAGTVLVLALDRYTAELRF